MMRLSETTILDLIGNKQGITLTEITEELGLKKANASNTLRFLYEKGLIIRKFDEDDMKKKIYYKA